MDRPLDKRRKVTWRVSGSLIEPPDRDGDAIWIVELKVTGNFAGYRYPTVQFMADRRSNGYDLKPVPGPKAPSPPFYMYTIGAYFRNPPNRDVDLNVRRVIDEEGRYCARVPRSSAQFFGNYELDPEEEERVLGGSIREGIWRAIITGNAYDQVHINESVWKSLVPYLLEMAKLPEMRKLESLFQSTVEREDVYTDTSYEESKMNEARPRAAKTAFDIDKHIRAELIGWMRGWKEDYEDAPLEDDGTPVFGEILTNKPEATLEDLFNMYPDDEMGYVGDAFRDVYDDAIREKYPDIDDDKAEKYVDLLYNKWMNKPLSEIWFPVEREHVHTDVGAYEEGISALIAKEVKLLGEVTELKPGRPITMPRGRSYPLIPMPAPMKVSSKPVEREDVHKDNGVYDE